MKRVGSGRRGRGPFAIRGVVLCFRSGEIAEKKLYENLVRWLSVMWRATRRTRDVRHDTRPFLKTANTDHCEHPSPNVL